MINNILSIYLPFSSITYYVFLGMSFDFLRLSLIICKRGIGTFLFVVRIEEIMDIMHISTMLGKY